MERIWKQLMRKKENIVLIGMPGSGKTTVGGMLAKELNREFCDTDEEIFRRIGQTPSDIISSRGEAAFRKIESDVIRDCVAGKWGAVIATGGGAILKQENERMLRRNGRIYLLDRPLEKLIPTDDRPLSCDRETLKKRYEERYERYHEAADAVITDPADATSAANCIREEFES